LEGGLDQEIYDMKMRSDIKDWRNVYAKGRSDRTILTINKKRRKLQLGRGKGGGVGGEGY